MLSDTHIQMVQVDMKTVAVDGTARIAGRKNAAVRSVLVVLVAAGCIGCSQLANGPQNSTATTAAEVAAVLAATAAAAGRPAGDIVAGRRVVGCKCFAVAAVPEGMVAGSSRLSRAADSLQHTVDMDTTCSGG